MKALALLMDMRSISKGFTLLETLLCLMVLTIISLLALSVYRTGDYSHYEFVDDYLEQQIESLTLGKRNYLDNGISFNEQGHVNRARTVSFWKRKVIVHLGNGFITIE